jgi:cardiolipin-specific phospholipase
MLRGNKQLKRLFHSGCKTLQEKPTKVKYQSDFFKSFRIWYNELCNYDDGDTISQDTFLSYVLPFYRSKELVEDRDKFIKAFNVKTQLNEIEEMDLSDKNQWVINEIRVEKGDSSSSDCNHLVMLHGFGASSGWFYKNYLGIIENSNNIDNLCLHGIDMIGFGLSGRPSVRYKYDSLTKASLEIETEGIEWGKYTTCVKCGGHLDGKKSKDKHWCYCSEEEEELRKGILKESKTGANIIVEKEDVVEYIKNHKELIEEVEDVYIDSLEKWRVKNKIEKFDLLAHSLGGYLGFSYCLKYPERVNKIIMVSPGGVERSPFAITNPDYIKLCENNDNKGKFKIPVSNFVENYGFLGRYGLINKTFRDIWNMRASIFTGLRWIGPFGPKVLIERNADKLTRSGNIKDEKEIELFLNYIYSCSIRASFSETSIQRIFDATVVGKYPILDKIRDEGFKIVDKQILWVYGEHDFMYKECGVQAINEFKRIQNKTKGELKQEMEIINNAGHNMYLDNSEQFNKTVIKFLKY